MGLAEISNVVLEFVRAHPNWASAIVFILAFGESLALVAAANPLIFWSIVASAATGAALGDWVSYWLGYHYHEQIQKMWPLKNHPKLIENGRAFFKRWGVWAIVLGRFSGPLRASVPIVAGIIEMPWLRFQIANWGSAFLWAYVLLAPGSAGMKWWLDRLG
jgi:membrane protein DedA with SNARE-associated domain